MNEQHFIAALQRALRSLPTAQREQVLADYSSHFEEARSRGLQEPEIARNLGDPRVIARNFLADYHMEQIQQPLAAQKPHTLLYHLGRGTLVLFSILIFNFFFLLWPLLLIALLLFGAWMIDLSFIVASFSFALALSTGALRAFVINSNYTKLALIFYSLAGTGAGVLLLGLLHLAIRTFLLGILRYIKANVKIIKPRV